MNRIQKPDFSLLKHFISQNQLGTIANLMLGEEGDFYYNKMEELNNLLKNMPKVGETDGQGKEALVHLHYFHACGFNWYITERDVTDPQHQAFGLADMGCPEMGYISIQEAIRAGAELDLYWEPKTIGAVNAETIPY